MKIQLMKHSSLDICAHAIRTCWQNLENDVEKQREKLQESVSYSVIDIFTLLLKGQKSIHNLIQQYIFHFKYLKNKKFQNLLNIKIQVINGTPSNKTSYLLKNIFGNNSSEPNNK